VDGIVTDDVAALRRVLADRGLWPASPTSLPPSQPTAPQGPFTPHERSTALSTSTPASVPTPSDEARARRSERRAWYMYDWAQSVFTTSVITVFLGPYLTALAEGGAGADGRISVFGWMITPASLYP